LPLNEDLEQPPTVPSTEHIDLPIEQSVLTKSLYFRFVDDEPTRTTSETSTISATTYSALFETTDSRIRSALPYPEVDVTASGWDEGRRAAPLHLIRCSTEDFVESLTTDDVKPPDTLPALAAVDPKAADVVASLVLLCSIPHVRVFVRKRPVKATIWRRNTHMIRPNKTNMATNGT
jgi:hypothetical protein